MKNKRASRVSTFPLHFSRLVLYNNSAEEERGSREEIKTTGRCKCYVADTRLYVMCNVREQVALGVDAWCGEF